MLICQDRVAFSGGFKIPEESIAKKASRSYKRDKGQSYDDEDEMQGVATKDEIFKALNIS